MSKHNLPAKFIMFSGWVLVVYVITHLLNHSMGIFGLQVLETARQYFIGFWRNPLITWIVPLSILIHAGFVLRKLFIKKTYKGLRSSEWVQIILGLGLPFLLVSHIYDTKVSHILYQIDDSYSYFLSSRYPQYLLVLFLVILMAWVHGVIGLTAYFNQKSWYPKVNNIWIGFATAVPLFALWGIVSAGSEIMRLKDDPTWLERLESYSNPLIIEIENKSEEFLTTFIAFYSGFLILFFLIRYLYHGLRVRRVGITIRYLGGKSLTVPKGTTLLEASLSGGIPHAHVCGGRGRCSTCRVQVVEGMEELSSPSKEEVNLLRKVKAGINVRLACKTMPTGHCTIYPLIHPDASTKGSPNRETGAGSDKNIAILFADLRGFTSISEEKLPYDVVFVLNQYFQYMGHAIEAHHGLIDKFIGDAIMALFGLDEGVEQGSRNALLAAKGMFHQLERLNLQLKGELPRPLEMGIGIHAGQVIVGEMGYKNSKNLAAIGDATNTASRLESLTKEFKSELVVSEAVMRNTGWDFSGFQPEDVQIRGRNKLMRVYPIMDVRSVDFELK